MPSASWVLSSTVDRLTCVVELPAGKVASSSVMLPTGKVVPSASVRPKSPPEGAILNATRSIPVAEPVRLKVHTAGLPSVTSSSEVTQTMELPTVAVAALVRVSVVASSSVKVTSTFSVASRSAATTA